MSSFFGCFSNLGYWFHSFTLKFHPSIWLWFNITNLALMILLPPGQPSGSADQQTSGPADQRISRPADQQISAPVDQQTSRSADPRMLRSQLLSGLPLAPLSER